MLETLLKLPCLILMGVGLGQVIIWWHTGVLRRVVRLALGRDPDELPDSGRAQE